MPFESRRLSGMNGRFLDAVCHFMLGIAATCLFEIYVIKTPEKRFVADTVYPEEVKLLKNALTEPQRARWARCTATSPCTEVHDRKSNHKCQNAHMRACMFQPLERE